MLLSANEGESRPMRLQFALKLVCLNLSLLVSGVILLELGAYIYYMARVAISGSGDKIAAWVDAIPTDAYPDRAWLMTGFRESFEALGGTQWAPYVAWREKPFSGRYVNLDGNGLRRTWNTPATQPVEIYVFGVRQCGGPVQGTIIPFLPLCRRCWHRSSLREFESRISDKVVMSTRRK